VRIGSLLRADAAQGGDGASPHYRQEGEELIPDPALTGLLERYLAKGNIAWHSGMVLSMDAYYRQTPEMVRDYGERGCLGVDMETAALLAVGQYRRVPVAALLVVSDELFTLNWQPGFQTPAFRQGRERAARVLLDAAAFWKGPDV
jgi:uridine phosphorylase